MSHEIDAPTIVHGAQSGPLHFGGWRYDERNGRLARDGTEVLLRPKTAGVLSALLEASGEIVAKQELLATVWGTTAVGDDVLAVCVNELRRILGDDSHHPLFIATAHRRGYRFIAPVSGPPALSDGTERLLVGRERELAELGGWWDAARAGRQIVGFVAGEPGIGRTAVVRGFAADVRGAAGAFVGEGRCVGRRGPGEPYSPFLDALNEMCHGPGGRHVREALWRYAPSWLLQLPGLVDDGDAAQLRARAGDPTGGVQFGRMLREFTDALRMLADNAPVLLVCDDLQAGDSGSVELVVSLATREYVGRVLLLATYPHPDGPTGARITGIVRDLRGHDALRTTELGPFDEPGVRAFLAHRLGTPPDPSLVADLVERSRGNPLQLARLVEWRTG